METLSKMAKMAIYRSEHDLTIANLAKDFERKKYTILINTTDKKLNHIPDLLVVSKKGQIEWIEVESKKYSRKKKKLADIVKALKQVGGKVRLLYMESEENEEG